MTNAKNRRPDRVAQAIRQVVAAFLSEHARDPRFGGFVTVTGAEITRDLRHATVYVSVLGPEADRDAAMSALAGLATHLRGPLARELRLRVAPEIAFRYDNSIARGARIEQLLAQVRDGTAPSNDPDAK